MTQAAQHFELLFGSRGVFSVRLRSKVRFQLLDGGFDTALRRPILICGSGSCASPLCLWRCASITATL